MLLYKYTRRKGGEAFIAVFFPVCLALLTLLFNFLSMRCLRIWPVSSFFPSPPNRKLTLEGSNAISLFSLGEHDGVDDLTPGTILTCSSSAKMIASVLTYPHEVLRTRLQMQPRLASGTTSLAASPSRNTSNLSSATQHRSIHTEILNRARRGAGPTSHYGTPRLSNLLSSAKRRRSISNLGNQGNRYTGVIQACSTIAREEGLRGFYRGMGVNLVRTVPSSALTILT